VNKHTWGKQTDKQDNAWKNLEYQIMHLNNKTTTNRDINENQLRRSSRIRDKTADWSKLPDNTNDKNGVYSTLSKHEKDTRYRINWKDFRVVWRDENRYRLLIKESLLIHAYKPALNRTTHSVPLIVFSDGLTTDLLPDPNGWKKCLSLSLSPFLTHSQPLSLTLNN
jgi:hypothetical protein